MSDKDDMREYHFHELKEVLNCCDETGWPTEDGGYRHTCHKHMKDK